MSATVVENNIANAAVFENASVLIAPLTAANPVGNAAPSSDWKYVGLLDGDQGFESSRDSQSKKHFAWGGILVAETDSQYAEEFTFTALEDNEVVRGIMYPGSTFTVDSATNSYTGTEVVPKKTPFKLMFEAKSNTGLLLRKVTSNYAKLSGYPVRAITESDLSSVKCTAAIYPIQDATTGAMKLWDVYRGPALTA